MSSNNPQQPPKNYQYASTTPSVSSLLNLTQVQDKKKPLGGLAGVSGLATATGNVGSSGLAGKPGTTVRTTAALGLAPTKQPLGTLKLKKAEPTSTSVPDVPQITETIVSGVIGTKMTETKASVVAETKASVAIENKTTVKSNIIAKVEKPKTEKHSITSQTKPKHIQTTPTPNDHFDPSHWRLFVGNLGPEVTESLLLTTFKNPYPSTSKILIVRDWKTQKPKGYAFVAFADGKEFLKALKEMNGKWIGNRQCIIKKSEHQPKF